MSTRAVPETKIWICDGCKKEVEGKHKPNHWTQLKWLRDAHDYQGHAVASDNLERDLCGHCSGILGTAINDAFETLVSTDG